MPSNEWNMTFSKRRDQISSLFWLFVGLGFASGGMHYGFGSWREPGAGFLPLLFGALLAFMSLLLFLAIGTSVVVADLYFLKSFTLEEAFRQGLFTTTAAISTTGYPGQDLQLFPSVTIVSKSPGLIVCPVMATLIA